MPARGCARRARGPRWPGLAGLLEGGFLPRQGERRGLLSGSGFWRSSHLGRTTQALRLPRNLRVQGGGAPLPGRTRNVFHIGHKLDLI